MKRTSSALWSPGMAFLWLSSLARLTSSLTLTHVPKLSHILSNSVLAERLTGSPALGHVQRGASRPSGHTALSWSSQSSVKTAAISCPQTSTGAPLQLPEVGGWCPHGSAAADGCRCGPHGPWKTSYPCSHPASRDEIENKNLVLTELSMSEAES